MYALCSDFGKCLSITIINLYCNALFIYDKLDLTTFIKKNSDFQVKTSHDVCKKAKIPSLGFAETAGKVFECGPPGARKWANFAQYVF